MSLGDPDRSRPELGSRGADSGTVGAVVIGRNEGERLVRCLASLVGQVDEVVYVDSGSTDRSLDVARSARVVGVELIPVPGTRFSAGAARNEGFRRLCSLKPGIRYVQFVDGDCEVSDAWIEDGRQVLEASPELAIVSGHVHEREARSSVYKRLFEMELHREPGDIRACGGNFMVRAEAFGAAGGFDTRVLAGEEPELCLRLRKSGWKIRHLDADMVVHESSITRFRPWWKRMVRGGFAYAHGASLHGAGAGLYCVREVLSILSWTLGITIATGLTTVLVGAAGLAVLALYPLQMTKIALGRRRFSGSRRSDAWIYAFFCLLGKWAQLWGLTLFAARGIALQGDHPFDGKSIFDPRGSVKKRT